MYTRSKFAKGLKNSEGFFSTSLFSGKCSKIIFTFIRAEHFNKRSVSYVYSLTLYFMVLLSMYLLCASLFLLFIPLPIQIYLYYINIGTYSNNFLLLCASPPPSVYKYLCQSSVASYRQVSIGTLFSLFYYIQRVDKFYPF